MARQVLRRRRTAKISSFYSHHLTERQRNVGFCLAKAIVQDDECSKEGLRKTFPIMVTIKETI
jgi:hypothetical protein